MPRLDDALMEFRRFAECPPAAPAPLADLEARARRRRLRRRAGGATVVAGLVAATALGVGVAIREDEDDTERVADPPAITAITAPAARHAATAEPNVDLRDGDQVRVEFEGTAVPGLSAQCAAEALDDLEVTSWCDLNVAGSRPEEAPSAIDVLTFEVSRVIETTNGIVDCAEAPRRCILGAYSGVNAAGEPMWAAISFNTDLPPIPASTLALDRSEVTDGDVLSVTGRGFRPGEDVFVSECIATDVCDLARSASVTADDEGAFRTAFRASAEIMTNDGWIACTPCELRASAFRVDAASVGINVAPGNAPARPAVRIVEPGPYAPDQRVTLEGSDFQVEGTDITVGWCRLDTPDGYPQCAYPTQGFLSGTEGGSFTVAGYPMPSAGFGCRAPERCALAWSPMEGSGPAFTTPFVMAP